MKKEKIIDILNNIEKLLNEEKYEELKEYINYTRITVKASTSDLENYIDDIIFNLE